ncbi:MarR family winged helix-turn-helix transcriptional regulator [Ferrimonas senticii]|uniref:MarR family winged helix-turn-helix transcriptional regulator n=1 Tax=Ferrimonas senticii TaxID=394566 RepID=UPI00041C86DC|nr:MarR family transcriptional regulator [Ferrimonas senticii]
MELLRLEKLAQTAKHFDLELNINQLWAFIMVCRNEGISSSELMQQTGLTKATASRALRLLADKVDPHRDGYHMIELRHDPKDYRVRRAYLTTKGLEVRSALEQAMQ